MPTVPTFAVRETDFSRTANVGTVGKNWLMRGPDLTDTQPSGGLRQKFTRDAQNMMTGNIHVIR